MPSNQIERRFSLVELMIYAVAWALIIGVVGMDLEDPPALIAIPTVLLPGPLIGGPIGLLIWGRRAFFQGAFVGLLIWIPILIYPAIGAVR